jgi:F420H(2)-dependent quinone reductase
MATSGADDYNTGIIKEFRANRVLAQELAGSARAALWPQLTSAYPELAEAQAKTERQFPLFVLTRQD